MIMLYEYSIPFFPPRISNHRRFWSGAAFDAFRFGTLAFRLHGSRKWRSGHAQESRHQGLRIGRCQILPRETGQHWLPGLSSPSLHSSYPKRNNPSLLFLLSPVYVSSYMLHKPCLISVDTVSLCRLPVSDLSTPVQDISNDYQFSETHQ